MANATLMIQTLKEEEILAQIEQVNDAQTRRALKSMFFWRMATQSIVKPLSSELSS